MDLSSSAGPRLQTGFAAFLTHDWGYDTQSRDNHARVRRVNAALQRLGFRCWFDEEQMRGDINEKMTSGIDNSSCVVVFVTKNYLLKAAGNGSNGADDNW